MVWHRMDVYPPDEERVVVVNMFEVYEFAWCEFMPDGSRSWSVPGCYDGERLSDYRWTRLPAPPAVSEWG